MDLTALEQEAVRLDVEEKLGRKEIAQRLGISAEHAWAIHTVFVLADKAKPTQLANAQKHIARKREAGVTTVPEGYTPEAVPQVVDLSPVPAEPAKPKKAKKAKGGGRNEATDNATADSSVAAV